VIVIGGVVNLYDEGSVPGGTRVSREGREDAKNKAGDR